VLLLSPALPRRARALAGLPPRARWALAAGGLLLAVHFLAWIASLQLTSVASSVVLVSTHPLWVAAWGAASGRERPGPRQLGAVTLCLAGTAVLAVGDAGASPDSLTGDLLALLGALAFAGYLLLGKGLRSRLPTVPYAVAVYGVAALALLAALPALGDRLGPYPPQLWLLFVALAVVPTIGGHTLMNWALAYLPATAVSLAMLAEPVGASLLAWWLLGQPPTAADALGGFLVLLGIGLYGGAAAN
jgi:drug/metabolite transporter (DMT)-like permease